ncbi:autotransporter-associated beta strand repeat-containing protein [Rhodanobacter aciditrophus]|uniref:autotransporter-associated beta strand repeat-containing protein n=1 Tax=Rhodanobacter aciditrophus TaxID=1623218 RepID=UPI003CE9C777
MSFGGNGGTGLTVGGGSVVSNSGLVAGGSGGPGGDATITTSRGEGGNGGAGITLAAGSTLSNAGSGRITGGNGGSYALDPFLGVSGGAAGVGVVASGNDAIVSAGRIGGGLSGDATPVQGDAVDLSGGGNTLTLEHGYSFTGNVVSASGTSNGGDTLALGGDSAGTGATGNGSFDLAQVFATLSPTYAGTQFVGFNAFAKTGNSTWTLTGSSTAATPWTISAGTLQMGTGASGGDATLAGNITDNAALVFNNTLASTFAGNITGTGTVTQQGSGALTYTGSSNGVAWTVAGGPLQVGDATTAATIVGSKGSAGSSAIPFTGAAGGAGGDGGTAVTGMANTALSIQAQSTVAGGAGNYGGRGSDGQSGAFGGAGGTGGRGGNGGNGIQGSGFALTGDGVITGGSGGSGGTGGRGGYGYTYGGKGGNGGNGGNGGPGIQGNDFVLTEGRITGGSGGYGGRGGGFVINGTVGNGGAGGAGGIGVQGNGFTLTDGSVIGGNGGSGGQGLVNGIGGSGGIGVQGSGFALIDDCVIGGNGANDVWSGSGGPGGVGAVSTGNASITTDTLIAGGKANGGSGAQADAVDLSGGGNILTLENGYSFSGNVVSTSGTQAGTNVTTGLQQAGDTLVLGGDGTGAGATGNGTFNASDIVAALPGSYAGTQYVGFHAFEKTGNSTWTLTGSGANNGATGENWTITGGTLQGDATALTGNIAFLPSGSAPVGVVFDQTSDGTYGGAISGSGMLTKIGAGTLALDGNSNGFAGSTTVAAGTLVVGSVAGNGATLGGNVTVYANATLRGHGSIGGNVDVQSGGIVTPGDSIGTLSVASDFTAAQGSQMNFAFGAPGAGFQTAGMGDSVTVGGNLVLNGATLNVTDAGGMEPGLYTVFSYGGTLTETNGGLSLGSTPAGQALFLQNLTGQKQINLVDTTGYTVSAWNANGLATSTQMGGGSGTWSTSSQVWTDATGTVPNGPMSPQPSFAVFGGTLGTVSVDDSAGSVSVAGLQFATNGYTLGGDTLTLAANGGVAPVIRVGDGSSAGMTATIDSVIAGSAGLTKADLGTLVLAGANTYTGTTTVNGGTLSVSSDANLGAASNAIAMSGGTLENNAAFATARSISLAGSGTLQTDANFTVSGVIVGTGALTKSGGGTLILSGTNTYSGGTTIAAGILQLGNGGTAGAIAGNVANNGSLAFDRSDAVSFAGVVSGNGSLVQKGSGTLTLTGANTYTGSTTISAGTLVVDGTSLPGAVTDNAALVFDQANDGTFSHAISGTGSFAKTGAGTLVLNSNNGAFTGSTAVNAGTLEVGDAGTPSAVLGGNVTVAGGGTLRGHGTIGGNVTNDGTVWAGGSIGTLTIQGNYTQAVNGVFEVEATPGGQASLLNVGGAATLAGTALVLADTGTWAPRTDYTVLTAAGGISGQFASTGVNLAFLTPVLSYATNAVTLSLQRNDINFNSVVQTPNQTAVATTANALGFGNPVYDALVVLDAPAARHAFDQLSGEIHASTRTAVADNDHYVRDAINAHLAGQGNNANGLNVTDASGVTAWTAVWGHWDSHDGGDNASDLAADGSGFLVGADLPVDGTARLGAVMGTGQGSARINALGSSSHVVDQHLGVYGSLQTGALQWQGGAIYGWQKVDTNRLIGFGRFNGTAVSSYHAHTAQAYADASLPFVHGHATLAPFANLAVERLNTPTIMEHGTPAALDVASQHSTLGYGTLGLRATFDLGAPDHGLHAHASLGWQHAWGDTLPVDTMRFQSGGGSFAIAGLPVAKDAGVVNAGLSFTIAPEVSVNGSYQGQFGQHTTDQSARISLDWKF